MTLLLNSQVESGHQSRSRVWWCRPQRVLIGICPQRSMHSLVWQPGKTTEGTSGAAPPSADGVARNRLTSSTDSPTSRLSLAEWRKKWMTRVRKSGRPFWYHFSIHRTGAESHGRQESQERRQGQEAKEGQKGSRRGKGGAQEVRRPPFRSTPRLSSTDRWPTPPSPRCGLPAPPAAQVRRRHCEAAVV